MCPSTGSTNLVSTLKMVDLPAPVRPTIPTFSPSLILKETSLSAKGRSLRYLRLTFLN